MAFIDSTRPYSEDMSCYNDQEASTSTYSLAVLPSCKSKATPNLPGYTWALGPHPSRTYTQSHCLCNFSEGPHLIPIEFPPSPPPTNSDPKRSIPLPSLGSNANAIAGPSSPILHQHLHSPPSLTKPVALLCFSDPMTPPPTVPTPTLALPPVETDTDAEFLPVHDLHDGWNASLVSLPTASSGTALDPASKDPLLSPISPEWTANGIPYDMPPSTPSNHDETKSVLLGGDDPHLFHNLGNISYIQKSDNNNNTSSPRCRPFLPHLEIPFGFSSPESSWSDSPTSSMDLDEELAMLATPDTIGMTMPSTPRSLPTTPFTHDLNIPSDDEKLYTSNKDNFYDSKYEYHLEPPLYEIPFLPELDDIPDSPSSPSLRSFSTLPPLEEDDDTDFRFESLHSPGTTLISLPGADTDDFLIPNDNDLEPYPSTSPFGSSSSLLLLEDDVLPRSPSPENYDVDDVDSVSIAGSSDPDIRRLGELQRRSQNAERAARQLEQTLLEEGAVHQRWEARRARKKEKERGREIGAMLRFKIAQEKERLKKTMDVDNILKSELEGGREGEEESPKVQAKMKMQKRKGTIGSMEQLVAKMLLRRNDTYRSLANRKTPLTSKFYMSSPLVHYGELYDGDNHKQTASPPWTATGEHGFEPWTPPEWTISLPLQDSSSFSSC